MILLNGSPAGSDGINDTLLIGNDGGVTFSNNGGRNNLNINGDGLIITQFYGMGGTNKYPDVLCSGALDNGIFTDTSNAWFQKSGGGDAGEVLVHPKNRGTFFANIWGSYNFLYGIKRTYNYWYNSNTWSKEGTFYNEPSDFNRPIRFHHIHPDTMYAGFRNLYRTMNASAQNGNNAQWDSISSFCVDNQVDNKATISAFAIAPSNDSIVYVAFGGPDWNMSVPHRKLFKTLNQWATKPIWVDISTNPDLSCLTWCYITDMIISAINPNKIWITCSGISSNVNNRVLRSTDGGLSWEDYSDGLTKFPVHCIRYKNGSPDGLYIGTDVGVYYTDSTIYNTNGWVSFNRNLPNPIVQDIEINDSLNLIRIATFGRGMWEADLNCGEGNNPTIVTNDTTWDFGICLDGDLIIDPNVTLTVKGEIAFPAVSKAIVKRGATLVLDGGKLTNRCSQMWLGVEVWGDRSLPQIPTTNHYQGMIIMKNNAMIENARIGITTSRKDSDGKILWDYTGGIILAANSTFINNYKAVEFLFYRYPNISAFTNCLFKINSALSGMTNGDLVQMVSLYEVRNVKFTGCDFENSLMNYTKKTNISPLDLGAGIYSIDASYYVREYCTQAPCSPPASKPSTFTGFLYGIKSINTNPCHLVDIKNSIFTKNYRGVYLSGTDYSSITGNQFYLPTPNYTGLDTLYGLYLNRTTGFSLQENAFKSNTIAPGSNKKFVGLIVNNSGYDPNEVYNNRFDTIQYGIIASNINREMLGRTGLCLKCNDFNYTKFDQAITYDENQYPDPRYFIGIARYQGSDTNVTSPAGNQFSGNHNSGTSDIHNDGGSLGYFYHQFWFPFNLRIYPDYRSENITPLMAENIQYSKELACPSRIDTGVSNPDQLKLDLLLEEAQTMSLNAQYTSLVDGGSTEATITDITYSIPPEALELRNDLLGKSPYLSDTVMISAISKENVLPNEMIRDILVANPQSAKSGNVIDEIENRFEPMPVTMMDEIMEGQEILGSMESLESHLEEHQQEEAFCFYELVRYYKQDTLHPWVHDSLIALLQCHHTLSAKYLLAFEYLETNEHDSATQVLNEIPLVFELTSQEQQQYQDYQEYFEIISDLSQQDQTIFDISSTQQSQLMLLANEGSEPVQSFSRNILIANKFMEYQEPVILPDDYQPSRPEFKKPAGSFALRGELKFFPNPSNQYVILEYNTGKTDSNVIKTVLTISSSNGKKMEERILWKSQDQILIDCRFFPAGLYLCKIQCEKNTIGTGKFAIIR